mmetsp:Transcript_8736/g.10086  ORF Transcript_8736/g.10086 Transcript_8736/m.10086 type:complete len:381 (-) Transcript_8736:43-1185(-)
MTLGDEEQISTARRNVEEEEVKDYDDEENVYNTHGSKSGVFDMITKNSKKYSAIAKEDEVSSSPLSKSATATATATLFGHTNIPPFSMIQSPNQFLMSNLVSDSCHTCRLVGTSIYVHWLDNVEHVRFLKFSLITCISILLFHPFVRWMGDWEHDSNYGLHDFFLYDFNMVALDVIMFFIVGRLYKRSGFDRLGPCLIPMIVGILYPSWSTADLSFLRHSFSTFDIVCNWPWQLFIYCIFVAVLGVIVITWHLKGFYQEGRLFSQLLEILFTFFVFILPIMCHPNFHLHHWYIARTGGMHFNLHDNFSQAVQAFFWGQYINGVAVWGRDPVLTCAYAYYVSTDIDCAYMRCNVDYSTNTTTDYVPFVEPDWHNCSASYAP